MTNDEIKSYVLERISFSNEKLYPYNNYLAYLLAKKKNQELKYYYSLDHSSSALSQIFSSLSIEDVNFSTNYYNESISSFSEDSIIYFYYGSSNKMFLEFFPDILPSDFNKLYSYLISNNLIKKIGTNLGKAYLISSEIVYHNFSSFTLDLPSADYHQAFDSMLKDISYLNQDREYLISLLVEKDQTIASLNASIDEAKYQHYISTTFTWR